MIGTPFIASIMFGATVVACDPLHSAVASLPGRLAWLVVLGAAICIAGALSACRARVLDVKPVLAKFKK